MSSKIDEQFERLFVSYGSITEMRQVFQEINVEIRTDERCKVLKAVLTILENSNSIDFALPPGHRGCNETVSRIHAREAAITNIRALYPEDYPEVQE